jgi:hypothetical protein
LQTAHLAYVYIILAEDFSELKRFKRAITKKTLALSFLGTGSDLEAFKSFVHALDWKKKIGVKTLGVYNHGGELVFVTTDKAVAAGNKPVDTIIQILKHRKINTTILDKPFLKNSQELQAFVLIFPPTETDPNYYVIPHFWIPKEGMHRRVRIHHVPYDR